VFTQCGGACCGKSTPALGPDHRDYQRLISIFWCLVVRLVRSGLGGCQQAGAVIAGWCLLRLSTLPRLPAPLGPGRRQATGECTCLQCPPTTPTARFSLVGGWGGLSSMCIHVWHLLQFHHTTSILVMDHRCRHPPLSQCSKPANYCCLSPGSSGILPLSALSANPGG